MRTVLSLLGRAVVFELRLYRSLFRWATRRPAVPSGTTPFAYVGAVVALLWAFVAGSAIELVVLHLLLPWETIRLAVDILGIWGLVWALGYTASLHVYPHLVTGSGLRVRHGFGTDITIPWEAVASVGVRERSREKSRALQVDRGEAGTVLSVVIASRTNVEVALARPVVVPVGGATEPVSELRFYVDDARTLVRRAREHLAQRDRPRG